MGKSQYLHYREGHPYIVYFAFIFKNWVHREFCLHIDSSVQVLPATPDENEHLAFCENGSMKMHLGWVTSINFSHNQPNAVKRPLVSVLCPSVHLTLISCTQTPILLHKLTFFSILSFFQRRKSNDLEINPSNNKKYILISICLHYKRLGKQATKRLTLLIGRLYLLDRWDFNGI